VQFTFFFLSVHFFFHFPSFSNTQNPQAKISAITHKNIQHSNSFSTHNIFFNHTRKMATKRFREEENCTGQNSTIDAPEQKKIKVEPKESLTLLQYILSDPERFYNNWEKHTEEIMFQIAVAIKKIHDEKTYTKDYYGPFLGNIFIHLDETGKPVVTMDPKCKMVGTFYDYFKIASIILRVLVQLISGGRHPGVYTLTESDKKGVDIAPSNNPITLHHSKVAFFFCNHIKWVLGLDPAHTNYDWDVEFRADDVFPTFQFVQSLERGFAYEAVTEFVVQANCALYKFIRNSGSCQTKQMTMERVINSLKSQDN
jgi:hypothetical protein